MAKDKNQTQATEGNQDDFDYSKFLPEGFEAKELRKIGGLTPIYAGKLALEQKWSPCVGYIVAMETLDMGEDEEPKQRYREFLIIEVSAPTKGVLGPKNEQEIVDVEKGGQILMPLSGNLKNIKSLRAAAGDSKRVYVGVFRVTGQKDTGRPTEMWVIDARIHPKTIERTGRFDLPRGATPAPELAPNGGTTSTGEVYDKDGVLKSAVGASAAS